MKFYTKRFIVRKLNIDDCYEVNQLLNDDNIIDNLNMEKHKTLSETRTFIQNYLDGEKQGEMFSFAIDDINSEKLVGVFLLKRDIYRGVGFEFTVFLNEKYRGIGAFGEIIPYMINFAFDNIKTKCLRAYIKEKNTYSKKAVEKAGFCLEKIFKVDGISGLIHTYIMKN